VDEAVRKVVAGPLRLRGGAGRYVR
jgi:hypothetical protein